MIRNLKKIKEIETKSLTDESRSPGADSISHDSGSLDSHGNFSSPHGNKTMFLNSKKVKNVAFAESPHNLTNEVSYQ